MSTHAIEARGLSKSFGGVLAVDSLDLVVDPGEVVGFLGPNGAGKTTTLRLLLGLLRPTSGEATILGRACGSLFARQHVGYVAGDVALWPQLTGRETLTLLASLHGSNDDAYRDLLIERFELDPDKRIRAYSKGNRQKVAIIAALATRADVLLLDEPTAGLDPLMERAFRESVAETQQRGQAVLLSSHMLSEVEQLCARVAMIRAGRLVTVANVSIPTIAGDLGVSPTQGTWIITSYAVANAIAMPLTGWLTTRFGQVRLIVTSILLFTIASWLCGLAPNIETLTTQRIR